jgi:hypothetical protein
VFQYPWNLENTALQLWNFHFVYMECLFLVGT